MGVTGFTNVTNSDTFDVPADVNRAVSFLAARIGETVATASALPAGVDAGRTVTALDTMVQYRWSGLGWESLSRHYASRSRNTGQSLATSTWTTITWPDDVSSASVSYSAGQFTVAAPGRYMVNAQVSFWTSSATGQRTIRLRRNNSTQVMSQQVVPSGTTYPAAASISFVLTCAAGDTIDVQGFQTSGGALNAGTNPDVQSFISIDRL